MVSGSRGGDPFDYLKLMTKVTRVVAAAIVVSGGFAAPAYAQCNQTGWCYVGTAERSGSAAYIKVLGGPYSRRVALRMDTNLSDPYRIVYDCPNWRFSLDDPSVPWKPILPGTIGEFAAKIACY